MDLIDRRSLLRSILGGVIAAGVATSLFSHTAEAMPLASQKDLGSKADDVRPNVYTVATRPPRRPVPSPRRRMHRGWRW